MRIVNVQLSENVSKAGVEPGTSVVSCQIELSWINLAYFSQPENLVYCLIRSTLTGLITDSAQLVENWQLTRMVTGSNSGLDIFPLIKKIITRIIY